MSNVEPAHFLHERDIAAGKQRLERLIDAFRCLGVAIGASDDALDEIEASAMEDTLAVDMVNAAIGSIEEYKGIQSKNKR